MRLTIILLFVCSLLTAQQHEVISYPASIDTDIKIKKLKDKATKYKPYKVEIKNPKNFKSFAFNQDSVLIYDALGCEITGMIYYVHGLVKDLSDSVSYSNATYGQWLINYVYSSDGKEFIANIPYVNSFLTHQQAVDFANGNLELINKAKFMAYLYEYEPIEEIIIK